MTLKQEFNELISLLVREQGVGGRFPGVHQLSWMLYLKFLDCYETKRKSDAKTDGKEYVPLFEKRFQWSEWACPKISGRKSAKKQTRAGNDLINFVNDELFPYLKSVSENTSSIPVDKSLLYSIGNIFQYVPNLFLSGEDMQEALNFVDKIDFSSETKLHEFAEIYDEFFQELSRVPGKANKYFTPRPLIRSIVKAIDPKMGESIYDSAAGTCGFLLESLRHTNSKDPQHIKSKNELFGCETIYGREISPSIYMMGLINMILHGVYPKNLYREDALEVKTNKRRAGSVYDIVLANIPYGTDVDSDIQQNFPIKYKRIEVLYLQHAMNSLKANGKAAVIVPSYMLSAAKNEFKQLRCELLEKYDLHTILRLPVSAFAPFSYIKTDVLFFDRKGKTSNVWFYDADWLLESKGNKYVSDKNLQEFVELFSRRETTDYSWMVPIEDLREHYNLIPDNPARKRVPKSETINYLERRKSDEIEFLSHLVDEVNDLLTDYLNEWFRKVKNRKLLEELIEVEAGIPIPEECELLNKKTDYPYLDVSNIQNFGKIDASSLKYLPNDAFNLLKKKSISEYDLYISILEPIGKTGIVSEELSGAILSPNVAKLIIMDKNNLNLKYLQLFTSTKDFQTQVLQTREYGDIDKINLKKLQKIEIPLCSFEQQRHLVDSVWEIKEKILSAEDMVTKQLLDEKDYLSENIRYLAGIKKSIKQLNKGADMTIGAIPKSNGKEEKLFKNRVWSYFVALLCSNRGSPSIPYSRINEVTIHKSVNGESFINGDNSADIVVACEDTNSHEKLSMTGYIKRSINITKSDLELGEFVSNVWKILDSKVEENKNSVALITTPIGTQQSTALGWLLNQAKQSTDTTEFFKEITNYTNESQIFNKVLDVFRFHLNEAKSGIDVRNEELFEFFKHINLIELDFGSGENVAPSILSQIMPQIAQNHSQNVWSRISRFIQNLDGSSPVINREKLPRELTDEFVDEIFVTMPEEFYFPEVGSKAGLDSFSPQNSKHLAILALIGSWHDGNSCDMEVLKSIEGFNGEKFQSIVEKLKQKFGKYVSNNEGTWKIHHREDLLEKVGAKLSRKNFESFKKVVETVLGTTFPEFEIPPERRFAASILNESPFYSDSLRQGIAEGLALLGCNPTFFNGGNPEFVENLPSQVVRTLLEEANWQQLCTLRSYLRYLAEAAPYEFITQIDNLLDSENFSWDKVFYQESYQIPIENHIEGLLWALEVLAWDENFLIPVCSLLGKLYKRESGVPFTKYSYHSLGKILLPWHPHTLANKKVRIRAVKKLLKENNDMAWHLLLKFLPNNDTRTMKTKTPVWRKSPSGEWKNNIDSKEYWEQINSYTGLTVEQIGKDFARLSDVLVYIDHLPPPAIDKLMEKLNSSDSTMFAEEEKILVWERLTEYILQQRKFSDTFWTLPKDKIDRLEQVVSKFAPERLINRYKYLFTEFESELMENRVDLVGQYNKLAERREIAIKKILTESGLEGVGQLISVVDTPHKVGETLAIMDDSKFDKKLLPKFLMSDNQKLKEFIRGYVYCRFLLKGIKWCDKILKKLFSNEETCIFLLSLPFVEDVWTRVEKSLTSNEFMYWKNVWISSQYTEDFNFAVEKLIQYGRPRASIHCLVRMLSKKMKVDSNLCAQSLLANKKTEEFSYEVSENMIIELVNYIQLDSELDENKKLQVELDYLHLFIDANQIRPLTIEHRLATNPEFFCEVVQKANGLTVDDKSNQNQPESDKQFVDALNNVLSMWKTPPGTESNGEFNPKKFKMWLQIVKQRCMENGLLEVALEVVGNVLVYAPGDTDGLWINRTIANALNERDIADMRGGYKSAVLDHAKTEKFHPTISVAENFNQKAEDIEGAGFHRFAATLRDIANNYELHVQ